MAITSDYLVSYCRQQIGKPYWNGTFGQAASKSLYNQKKAQLPKEYLWPYDKSVEGIKVHDCCGLIKAACWCDSPSSPYKSGYPSGKNPGKNGCGDWSVYMMYNKCSEKGSIKNMPEIPGLLLFNDSLGHVGVYAGGGMVIEARGHAFGVQINKVASRSFSKWGRLSCCINYSSATPKPEIDYKSKVKEFQEWLNVNYNSKISPDGYFGKQSKTAAIKAIQTELNKLGEKLVIDGGFGKLTKAAMSRHIIKIGSKGNLVYIAQGCFYGHSCNCNGFDGSFGAGMDECTKIYQKANKLEVDGKIGGETFYSLVK